MDENDEDRRRRTPWDDLFGDFDDEFEQMRERMNKIMEQMLRGSYFSEKEPMIYGFSMRTGPDGKPRFQEFGNTSPQTRIQRGSAREPLTDIMEEEGRIRIIVELPGVDKEDIHLNASERSLSINVDTENRKFSKRMELPCEVDPDSAKAKYNNGVLEILLDKHQKGSEGKTIEIE